MRNLFYIFFLLISLAACHDNADYPFSGNDAVYFQLESNDYYWSRTLDSLVYTFAGKGVNEDTLWVRVNLEGNTTSEARLVNVIVDENKTTAIAGLHYEALKEKYELPGDSVYMYVPVIIYNKDKELENKKVEIILTLQPSESLALGITERLSCRLIVSNTLTPPTYWEGTIRYSFGDYSRVKHERCIEVLKRDFPATSGEYYEEYTMWQVYGSYMSDYFKDHYPVLDETKTPIEPW